MRVVIQDRANSLIDNEFSEQILSKFFVNISDLLLTPTVGIISQVLWKVKAAIVLYGVLFLSLASLGMLWMQYKLDKITFLLANRLE